jgi:hypothetical protein
MYGRLACLAFFILVSGCIYTGRDFAATQVENIENNVTTQKEIFSYFGEPFAEAWKTAMEPGLILTSFMSLASYVT